MRWKKAVIIILTIITLVLMAGIYIGFFYNYSTGQRVGSIAKLSHKGKSHQNLGRSAYHRWNGGKQRF